MPMKLLDPPFAKWANNFAPIEIRRRGSLTIVRLRQQSANGEPDILTVVCCLEITTSSIPVETDAESSPAIAAKWSTSPSCY